MKTKEQASYESLIQSPSYVVKHDSVFHEGFSRGVEFAQRWIPVEEELPPKENDTDESEIVLIRETQDFGNFFLGWYDYHQKAWFMVYRLHMVKPTHWRPVHFL